ncbi:MAG: exosortase/archaeosortase family protein [Myxococcota bacterium]|nr:exosortase [Myxococcales bacterium]
MSASAPARGGGRPADAGARSRTWVAFAAAVAALVAVYGQILRYMVLHWTQVEDYQHAFIVAPLALYFAWERRAKLRRVALDGSWLGLVPLALGVASLAVGRLGVELTTMRAGFVLSLIGLVLLLLGREVFRILAFPLLFLFLMIPLPQSLVNVVAFPLQLVAARAAVAAMQALGIPVLLEGNIIHLAQTSLFVEEACSGLRSLTALVTVGVLFAYFFRKSLGERAILVASTIPIAILVNAFRVALTGVLAHAYGEQAATGVVHELQGVATYVIALAILFAEAALLSKLWRRLPARVRRALA